MTTPRPPQPEFIGGPEDGRIMDEQLSQELEATASGGDGRNIPVLLRGDDAESFEEGDEIEVVLMGFYVREEGSDPPKFRWVEV